MSQSSILQIGPYRVRTSPVPGCSVYTCYEILDDDGKTVVASQISRPSETDCGDAIRAFHNKAVMQQLRKRLEEERKTRTRLAWLRRYPNRKNQKTAHDLELLAGEETEEAA